MTGGGASWLAELARPASGPVPWARMAHAALAVCGPLGLGIAAGQPVPGLLAGMGGLLAVVVDPGGPYPQRARRIGTAAVGGAAAGIVVGGQIHGQGVVTAVVLVAVAGVSALLSAAGNVASVTGLQLLVYSILGTGPLGTIRPWWQPPAGVLTGAAWGILLLAPAWVRSPRAAEQRGVVSVGVAAVVSELLPVQRSYWILLTVAIVLRPDFGSVFARAVQRGIGTVIGAVAGAAILAVIPYGPLLLLPCAVLAALLPYGRSRNYGLFSMFLTPLVVVLIDLLTAVGWRLAEDRLIDTLLGCAIALLIGYVPWPGAWHAHLPGQFANAVDKVSRYTGEALLRRSPQRPGLRRQTYRALSDLRTEFQRTVAEPPAVSRRAAARWPALVALESVMDKVTASAVRMDWGASPPAAGEVAQVRAALTAISRAVATDTRPPALPVPVTGSPAIRPAACAVREVQRALAAAPGAPAAG